MPKQSINTIEKRYIKKFGDDAVYELNAAETPIFNYPNYLDGYQEWKEDIDTQRNYLIQKINKSGIQAYVEDIALNF